jgi:soluble P-type ATPase
MIEIDIPGRPSLALSHAVFDVNGTLTDRGRLLDGVSERIRELAQQLEVHLASADTFGGLAGVAGALGVEAVRAGDRQAKVGLVARLGADTTVLVGNGANDAPAMAVAALAVAVVGREGASAEALSAADVICVSVLDAIDLLLEPRALVATLRR